jgi:large subunit ribosomal protein L4
MANAKLYAKDGTERGTLELPGGLFGCDVNEAAMHQTVKAYLANQRQGNASTKERSDVRGGGKKPFRQKGTGRARAGTIRSPLWRGGGTVFGPQPRDYRQSVPKKVRRLALRSALSSRAATNDVIVIDDLQYTEPKTKRFAQLLDNVGGGDAKVLFVIDAPRPEVIKSARNLPNVKITMGRDLTTYDVLWAEKLIISESALKAIEEAFKQ